MDCWQFTCAWAFFHIPKDINSTVTPGPLTYYDTVALILVPVVLLTQGLDSLWCIWNMKSLLLLDYYGQFSIISRFPCWSCGTTTLTQYANLLWSRRYLCLGNLLMHFSGICLYYVHITECRRSRPVALFLTWWHQQVGTWIEHTSFSMPADAGSLPQHQIHKKRLSLMTTCTSVCHVQALLAQLRSVNTM